ncbi:anaphase-promoting complex subunit 2 [Exophiala aquamarina CBS 119918]|uniref:Anaphase-promoting complex subunit 2 n=1 Tax=Exophiala aquamarina CBS 119918 TaxID=1182545 RepID=A0A072PTP2_9EURO|nr:anaphase-promoting complex subunit 2 [Exophiala aquamarina CBS 119918]KEF63474.1 anaphase-promoting complex subunit 2 [Exophiala aquamarina CBS 119918]
MLTAQSPTTPSIRGGAFASVFTSSTVNPPAQKQRFRQAVTSSISEIRSQFHTHLRLLFGVGDEDYRYGSEVPVSGPDPMCRFTPHLASCEPLNKLREPSKIDHAAQVARDMQSPLWVLLEQWKATVGTEVLNRLLAQVVDDLLTDFVTWSYARVYRPGIFMHLKFWVRFIFCRVVNEVLLRIGARTLDSDDAETEYRKWVDTVTTRLGALRTDELFDIVVDWDSTATAMDDLRHFARNPATRSYLTHNFADALQARLLHPGASTIEILQVYIAIIRSFRSLDPKGVLLDRVARKVRRYLRDRDDTVKVIVTGLLSDTTGDNDEDTAYDPDTLTELAVELPKWDNSRNGADDGEDYDNMKWVPPPIDAANDYTKSSNTDVIGSLISLFDSRDVVVKELQAVLAERLLKNKQDFNQEISVLEHLKIRFGESALQACEVMLRDVQDSRKVDNVVRRDQGMQDENGQPLHDEVQLHAKILSRLFWPSFPDQTFNVPQVVLDQQENYEKGFESLKQSRKLTWLNGTGQVEVELELEDRVYQGEVLPWQAVVIYAFQGESGDPVSKEVATVALDLDMSPTLVRSACIFWVSKRILAETSKDVFLVCEKLPDGGDANMDEDVGRSDTAAAAAAAEVAAQQAAKEAEEAERKQNMAMYHQFILSMLTNQGAMPLPRIAMMLGIVVPGGFPFSNEELKEFLASMVKDGALVVGNGGAYKVAS